MKEATVSPTKPPQLVDAEHAGRRLDNYLISFYKKIPKSHIYRMIRRGRVRVDGRRSKVDYRIKEGEKLFIPAMTSRRPDATPLNIKDEEKEFILNQILYENGDFMIMNKPAGYSMHAGGKCNFGLTEMLRVLRGPKITPVHRLDRSTSGCLIFSKTHQALREMHHAFREREVLKEYLTLVIGKWDRKKELIQVPITVRHERTGADIQVDFEAGSPAKTRFKVVRDFANYTLLRAELITGRMHQIRVHTRHEEHPVAGDSRYGLFEENRILKKQYGLQRLFLHCDLLQFKYGGEKFTFNAQLPSELQVVLDQLPMFN